MAICDGAIYSRGAVSTQQGSTQQVVPSNPLFIATHCSIPGFIPVSIPVAQVVPGNPLDDVKLLVQTVGSILRGTALRNSAAKTVSFTARPLPSVEKPKKAKAPAEAKVPAAAA